MLTAAASAAGAAPHERMQALLHGGQCEELRTREQELAKAHEHMRAAQWALAHASMVAGCDEWGPDGEEWEEDWEDWQDDTPASSEPGTPDWRDQFDKILDEDNERAKMKRDRVCQALGCVTYKSPNGLAVAQQCEDGGIWFQGERYTGIRDWLRRCFSKKI